MDRQEKVGFVLICHLRTSLQWHKSIVRPGVNYFAAHTLLDQFAQSFGDIQHQVLFYEAALANCPLVTPAVPGIDDNAIDF